MISFRSQAAKRVLNYYFLNKGVRAYTNQLARLLGLDPKNLDRKLKELEKRGLLKSEFSGHQRYFFLNNKFPLLKEYKSVFLKTIGLEDTLKKALMHLPQLKAAYLFGSYAKDKLDASSDIDILLVGSHSGLAAQKLILPIQKNCDREINIIDMSEKEFKAKKKKGDDFLKDIFSKKIIKLL